MTCEIQMNTQFGGRAEMQMKVSGIYSLRCLAVKSAKFSLDIRDEDEVQGGYTSMTKKGVYGNH